MTCAKSYQDIKAPWEDEKSPSEWFRDFYDAYCEEWGELSDEDYKVLHKFWNSFAREYDDMSGLELSIAEMKEILQAKKVEKGGLYANANGI